MLTRRDVKINRFGWRTVGMTLVVALVRGNYRQGSPYG